MLKQLDLLERLCGAPGIPGHEGPVVEVIGAYLAERDISMSSDRLGNLVAVIPAGASRPGSGPPPRVMVFAHTDEVGFIVRKIRPDGFLNVERVGGAAVHALPGQRLDVWTSHGALPAVAGARPQHLAGDSVTAGLSDSYLDVGACTREEAAQLGVEVGSPITYASTFQQINGRLSAKALDDRLGCFILLQLADWLRGNPPGCAVHLAFVVQEETLLRGALPVVAAVRPDWAVGLDGTLAFDTPDLADGQTDVRLGGGPAIKVMDHLRGTGQGFIAHLGLRRHLEALAAARGIPIQREVVIGLTTAAAPLPFAGTGLPVAAVSFPLRYAHAPVEVADARDVQATLELFQAIVMEPWLG